MNQSKAEAAMSRVEKWARDKAPSVAAVQAAGRRRTERGTPNELVVRVHRARGLFPPEAMVRRGGVAVEAAGGHGDGVAPQGGLGQADCGGSRKVGL